MLDWMFLQEESGQILACSHQRKSLEALYRENEKKRLYGDPVLNVEKGTFTQFVYLNLWHGGRVLLAEQEVGAVDI